MRVAHGSGARRNTSSAEVERPAILRPPFTPRDRMIGCRSRAPVPAHACTGNHFQTREKEAFVRALKSALCLVMLGAGIAAVPSQLAGAAAAPAAADDSSLVREMRGEAEGSVVTSAEDATGKVGFIRAKGADADLLPASRPTTRPARPPRPTPTWPSTPPRSAPARASSSATASGRRPLGWTVDYTQCYKGLPGLRLAAARPRRQAGRPHRGQRLRRPGPVAEHRPRRSAAAAADRAIAFVGGPAPTSPARRGRALEAGGAPPTT